MVHIIIARIVHRLELDNELKKEGSSPKTRLNCTYAPKAKTDVEGI